MLKIETCFQNRIPSANLIFRDKENRGVNLIYYPELGNSGIEFINKYRKKNYWDYVIIPMTFTFLSHKTYTNNYYKDFKKSIPMVRLQRKFTKNNQETRSTVIDLTPLSENFSAYSKSRSKKQTMEAFIKLIEGFALDNKTFTGKDCYLLVDGNGVDEKELTKSIFYFARLNSGKLRIKDISGIVLYGNKRFWPLTIKDKDKDGDFLKINLNVFSRYMKEVHGEEIDSKEVKPDEAIQQTKNVVEKLYQVHMGRKSKSIKNMYTDKIAKADTDIEEDPLELIKSEVNRNQFLKGNTFEEKLSNLFKSKSKKEEKPKTKKEENQEKTDHKIKKMVTTINENLQELNKKHNGVVEVDEKILERNSKNFYKPLDVIGFKDFHAYNKQETEFGENLDQAMFDLIKSIESDKEIGIKVLNIRTEITDTYRDRFKTYKIKIQHKDFGHKKPYTVSFHVPIPSKGKYLKVGGNDYIMINQFFAKPVIKVSPKMVRVYTHYSTCAIHLKHHALNDEDGISSVLENFADMLKYGKKLKKKPHVLTKEEVEKVKNKYDLPDFLNNDIFVNLELKD
jgi:hypothetical protein